MNNLDLLYDAIDDALDDLAERNGWIRDADERR